MSNANPVKVNMIQLVGKNKTPIYTYLFTIMITHEYSKELFIPQLWAEFLKVGGDTEEFETWLNKQGFITFYENHDTVSISYP